MTGRPSSVVVVVAAFLGNGLTGCSPDDDRVNSPDPTDGRQFAIEQQLAFADQYTRDQLHVVEDSLVAVILGRFSPGEQDLIRARLAPDSRGGVMSVRGDSIAADAWGKLDAVRRRLKEGAVAEIDLWDTSDHIAGSPDSARRRMFQGGMIPVGIGIADTLPPGSGGVVLVRRANARPYDLVLLSAAAAGPEELKKGLGALFMVHRTFGPCPAQDAILRARGNAAPPPGMWKPGDDERARGLVRRLANAPHVELPGIGRVQVKEIWIRRLYSDRQPVRLPLPTSDTCER